MWAPVGALDPARELEALVRAVREQFPLAFEADPAEKRIAAPAPLQHYLAGLMMVADWLGSSREVFALTSGNETDAARIERARRGARGLLAHSRLSGLLGNPALFATLPVITFEALFGKRPRPLQATIAELDVQTPAVRTLVAESDTGSGKTEAALLWWARLRTAGKVEGLYFALPTRVAARQLYERVVKFVEQHYRPGERPPVLLAVPGYARMNTPDALALPAVGAQTDDNEAQTAALALRWASEKAKRFLAAPIVVGTVDQALLSTLQSNHAHLRAALLDRQLLVVDEVHASDAYMRKLLQDLLAHRRCVNAYSLLLSATLGSEARETLLGSSRAMPFAAAAHTAYPLLSAEEGFSVAPQGLQGLQGVSKHVQVRPLALLDDFRGIAKQAARAVRDGARVLVVMNTVRRARAVQAALEAELGSEHPALFRVRGVPCAHHGRYAAVDREVLDVEVERFLGKDAPNVPRVLVGTQTLEQSLDIDADVLITDLCPMDVLLQRIGRLWRHARSGRPEGWAADGVAQCLLVVPEGSLTAALGDGARLKALRSAGLGSVYGDLRVLDLTLACLTERAGRLDLPAHNRELVEAVVHSERLQGYDQVAWTRVAAQVEGVQAHQRVSAQLASARAVFEANFGDDACHFDADAAAVTRLGDGTALLTLAQPVRTPFGQTLHGIQVPGQDLREAMARLGQAWVERLKVPAKAAPTSEGFVLEWEGLRWRYDRAGLQRD